MIPKLSIITVNLNNVDGLLKTIESVVEQTFSDYEYIVIDGGSIDGSVESIKKYADKIRYWVSEPDKGIYNAMNKGIKQAKGEYCLFLNSGDWLFEKDTLSNVFKKFPDQDIVYGNLQTPKGTWTYPQKLTFSVFFFSSIAHPATFIRKSLFDTYGYYNENYTIASDWEFFIIALVKNNCSYKHIDNTISCFEFGGMSTDEKYTVIRLKECEDILRKLFPLMYDDYIELQAKREELEFYLNSKLMQTVKKIQQGKLYKMIRGIN
ncbi:MAG: glycosyltransferase [Bacteroidetes bacterium]|nr:glycosyltransferase [Bacteroidota bacterium]